MSLFISVLGGFSVTDRDGRWYVFRAARQRALLAYLALSPKRDFSRSHLAELLWPEAPDDEARHSLRQCLLLTRRGLGPDADALILDGDRVRLEPDRFETDVALLHRLATSMDPSDWKRVNEVYHGELLAGIDIGGTRFESWLAAQRHVTSELLSHIAEAQSSAGDLSGAIITVRRIADLDPFDEVQRRQLMRLFVRQGRSASAVREYRELSQLLREQLAVEPSSETTHLYQSVIDGYRETPNNEAAMLRTYAHVLEQLPDCIVVTDLATRIVGFGPIAERQFGLSKEDVLGKTPAVLYGSDPATAFPVRFAHLALTHGRWTETVRLTTHDGMVHPIRRSVVTLRLPSGQAIGSFGMNEPSKS